jgi:thiol-disulfide isomerase/thioredoxin
MCKNLFSVALSFLLSIYTLIGFNQNAKSREMEFLKAQMKPRIVIFSANWCLPCKMIHKWMKEDSTIKNLLSHYDVEIYDYDLDKDMRTKYNVSKIPTLIVIKNEEEQDRRIGIATGKRGLELFLEAYK